MTEHTSVSNIFLSVCIPSYNRPSYLGDLLETVTQQNYKNYEIVICDDNSPLKNEIKNVILNKENKYPSCIFRFIQNTKTLGYDGNFRKLIKNARGDYCVFMGDDDLLCPGALRRIASVAKENPGIGVIIRAWASAERESKVVIEEHNYFDGDRFFDPGRLAVSTLFRRSVAIAGYTINRRMANKAATDRFDGTLLYQSYLTGLVAYSCGGYYISDRIAIMLEDPGQKAHFFGNAEVEKDKYKPGTLSTNNSLNFVNGMVEIAKYLANYHTDNRLYEEIINDIGNYSYPILSIQRNKPIPEFIRYFNSLRKVGFSRNPYLYLYFFILLLLGRNLSGKLIVFIKHILGRAPVIGKLNTGKLVRKSNQLV